MKAKDAAIDIKKRGLPVFVWGYWTEVTTFTANALKKFGVVIDGYIRTDNVKEPKVDGRIISETELLSEYKEYVIAKGYIEHFYWADEVYYKRFPGCKAVYEITDFNDVLNVVEPYDEDFCDRYKDNIARIKRSLYDDLSSQSFDAFIEMKVYGNSEIAKQCLENSQYFFESAPWELGKDEIFFDCGAYDGDSAKSFIDVCGGNYTGIIAFEPDSVNYLKLMEYFDGLNHKNIIALEYGVGSKKDDVKFDEDGSSRSRVIDIENGVLIHIDTIDNIVSEYDLAPTIIKMDIEGMEVEALKGAMETIKKYRPILMVCAYHKKNDLFEIFDLVNSMVDDYCWYFRCHRPMTIEAVYYIVPKERVKK